MKWILEDCRHRHFARIRRLALITFAFWLPLQTVQAAPDRIFNGVDLVELRQVQRLRAMPEVYEMDSETRRYRLVDTVIQLPLDGTWITYNPTRNVFYLNKVPGENDATYFGPIQGDPFDKFKLEERMLAKFRENYAT